jgi:single-stranded DNA-binding protein
MWEKSGQKHYTTEVVLRQFNSALQMLDSAPAAEHPEGQPSQRAPQPGPSGRR